MRKTPVLVLCICLLLSFAVSSVGAQAKSQFVGDPKETYYMITFLSGHPFWVGCRLGMEAAAKQLGVKTLYGGDPEYDVNKAIAAFEQIAATKPKGILLTCISPEPFVEVINKAVESGVPVITFDTDSPNSKRLSYVSTDNSYLGEFLCKFMVEKLMGGEGIVGITGRPAQLNIRQRMDGFAKRAAADYPKVKLVGPVDNQGDLVKSTAACAALLQANPKMKAFFAADGIGAAGAQQACADANRTDIKIMTVDSTQDVLDLIKADKLYGTVAQNTFNMGYWAMIEMYIYTHTMVSPFNNWKAEKISPLPPYINSGVDIVTKQNADAFVVPKK
jgi:ribose transport system substrate-binding protein